MSHPSAATMRTTAEPTLKNDHQSQWLSSGGIVAPAMTTGRGVAVTVGVACGVPVAVGVGVPVAASVGVETAARVI